MAEETKIIRIVVDSSRAVDGSAAATRALERMERAQGEAASSLDRMEKAMGRVGGYMKAQLAIMAADLAARLLQIGRDAFNAASGMGELADQLGITTRGLQALQYSAVQNGVEMAQLETGISKFSQKIGEAAGGSKEMIEALNGLGVKVLDLNGQLRPTETLIQEVAASILAIDDPAKRAAVSVDFFGKAGTKFLPVLQDMAKGLDSLGAAAERGSAMMSERTIARLDQIADSFARSAQKWRASAANLMVDVLEDIEARLARVNVRFTEADWAKGMAYNKRALEDVSNFLENGIRNALDEAALAGGRFVVTFISYFKALPEQLPKLFIDALNASIEAVESGLNVIGSTIAMKYPWLSGKAGISGDMVSFGRIGGGGANTASDRFSAAIQAGSDWEAGKRAEFNQFYAQQRAERERAALIQRQVGYANDEDAARRGPLGAVGGAGVSNPPVKGAGDAAADRMAKALGDSARELEQARAFAEAANQGADAVARLEAHFKALKTAQDVFGKAANDNAAGVAELTAKLEEQALATQKLKNLGDFRADTAKLREQNEILEAEVRLANELPEVRARELALLKTMQEVKAKGLEGETEAIEQRRQAIEQNERLKAQGEEIKRSTELWTAPFKSALESIQRSTADWIDSMLQGLEQGKFSMADFGKIGLSVLRRMAAEIISLAVMRPMLGSVVNGLSSIGVISPATAASMGYGTTGVAGAAGGGMSMPSLGGGGFGNLFGGSSDFFSRPIASVFSSSASAGGYADISALLQSGNTGASAAASGIGGLGGISIGQGLGALAGAGMGVYNLINSRSTGQTLGGIGSIIGAGVSLIPGVGQIAGPIISLASALLPSLFGESNTRTHSSTNANLRYGSGGWYTTGGAYGAGANSSQGEASLRGNTTGIDALFGLMGGIKDPSKVWGLDASSWTAQGKNWSYTSNATHLVDPSGNRTAWRMNTDGMENTGAAQVAILSMLGGAVGELGANARTALEAMRNYAPTMEEVGKNLAFVTDVYDQLGKAVISIKPQFDELTKRFAEMTTTATKLGLALAPIEAEQKKQTERLGQDFIDNLIDPIAAQLRAWEDEKATILANVDYIREHTDVVVDMARINEALLRKEAVLKEQLYGGAISQLEDAIKRLSPGGDLANLDPSGTYAGMKASWQATFAQASTGDAAAIGRFGAESSAYADYAKAFYAGSPAYEAIRQQIVDALQTVQASVVGQVTPSTDAASPASNPNGAQMQQLMSTVNNLVTELQAERAESAKLRALLSRYITTQSAA